MRLLLALSRPLMLSLLPLVLLLLPSADARAAVPTSCLPATPLPLNVRIGTAPPGPALLIGGSAPALRLVDARSGATLWSADAVAPASQLFAAMSAAFAGSLIALDTDNDGLADRIYAGDLAGRLWRFDLHNGAPADAWASGGVFADLSNDAGRGFLAPPDVSLATPAGAEPWFNIAIGTAAPGTVSANNRLYVLRDYAPFNAWTDAQYRAWQPLRESDLLQITSAGEAASVAIHAGWFVELGSGDVLTASLTVGGSAVFAIADSVAGAGAVTGCRSTFSIATLDLSHNRLLPVADRDAGGDAGGWRRVLGGDMTLDTSFTLAAEDDANALAAQCTFGNARVAECDVDLHPHRTWWRRDDAE